jgi:N-acetylglutamate synthase-like GNAT family acetyltransferase
MLKDAVGLRPATELDWRAVASLLDENQLPLEGAHAHLSDFLVATTDGAIVGCAGAEVYRDLALLRSVAVAPIMKGKGIGKSLVGRLLNDAKRREIARIYLLTLHAEQYFARFGFLRQPMEQAPAPLNASAEFQGACPANAVLMSLSLASWSA